MLDVALDILEREGVERLTMRALAARLGVAVTAIYWHVGNKETLLDELVDRIITSVGDVHAVGSAPAERIVSLGRSLRSNLLAHPDLVGVAHQQGRHAVVFVPARRGLAEEFTAAGLPSDEVAVAVQAVVHLVVGSVLIERAMHRSPAPAPDLPDLPELAADIDHDELFERSLKALVAGLVTP